MPRMNQVVTVIIATGLAVALGACGASTVKPGSETTPPSASVAPPSSTVSVAPPSGTASEAPTSDAGTGGVAPASGTGSAGPTSGGTTSAAPSTGEPESMDLNLAADPTLAAMVPDKIKAAGKIVIATDATYPPNEFLPGGAGTPVGMDVDLGNAIAQLLGVKADWQPTGFDGILAGINAGRYDISLSSFTDTKEREQQVNFVTYFQAGVSTMVVKGNPDNISTPTDLCGKKVGAENGTTELDMLTKADSDNSVVKACADAGKPAPQASGYPKQTDVNVALASGRLDAYLADTPVVDYAVKITGDKFQKVGKDEGVAPYGIAVPKTPAALTTAIQGAVQKLMDDGDYMKILQNWGVEAGAITKSEVNKALS